MRTIRPVGVWQPAVREVEKPLPGAGELLVRMEACGICGTDRHPFLGEFPSRAPVTLGYAFAGTGWADGNPGVSSFAPGLNGTGDPDVACGRDPPCHRKRVHLCRNLQAIGIHCDGGFADKLAMLEGEAHSLPDGFGSVQGAFCKPLACCLPPHGYRGDPCRREGRAAGRRRSRGRGGGRGKSEAP